MDQTQIAGLMGRLDERESELRQQLHKLRREYDEWHDIHTTLSTKEATLSEWETKATNRQVGRFDAE